MSCDELLAQLRASELIPVERLDLLRPDMFHDELALATDLARAGLLTTYQARELVEGRGAALRLGQYQILDELGRGGFGCVYKARHVLMERVVALKVIAPQRIEDSRSRSWFLREVRATTRLKHPNIVMAYDAAEVDGRFFLAMEYIDGITLHRLVQQQGPLPLGLAWQMLREATAALAYAHEQHLVHRDIKPANLLIPRGAEGAGRGEPVVKVVDFGLARLQDQDTSLSVGASQDWGFVGTPDFVSPEQARDRSEVDIRADLYSLGCTFYFALSGRRPFVGATPMEVVLQHLETEAAALDQLRPEIPAPLVGVVRRLMEKRRENRFQSPQALLAELDFLCPADSGPTQNARPRLLTPAAAPISPKYMGDLGGPPLVPSRALTPSESEEMAALPVTVATPHELVPSGLAMPATPATQVEEPPRLSAAPAPLEAAPPPAAASAAADTLRSAQTHVELPQPAAPAAHGDPRDLRWCWLRWYSYVEDVWKRRGSLPDPAEYRGVHAILLRSLRAAAEADPTRRPQYERVIALVEPWVSVTSLTATEPQTLESLLQRYRQLGQPLGLHLRGSGWVWASLLALATCLLPLMIQMVQRRGVSSLPRNLSLSELGRFVEMNPLLVLAVLLPGAVLAGFMILGRLLGR